MNSTAPYGFRVVGSPFADRRLVDWQAAFLGYCQCDERADVEREGYLSAFTFDADFRRLLAATGSPKGYSGLCGSPWLWWDIDREGDLERATSDARRLAAALAERYRLDGDELLLFLSGGKGYHLGLPLSRAGSPAPAVTFNAVARRFAERFAERLGFATDAGVYDRVRLFRAPNSRHPKTGLHKRRLTFAELLHLGTPAILRLAEQPEPFDPPEPPAPDAQAVADWNEAETATQAAATARRERQGAGAAAGRLNRRTLAVIRGELPTGDRHRLLFSAAANLAELACPPGLAHELLTEAGLDAGLSPSETRRQIDCGLAAGLAPGTTAADCDQAPPTGPPTEPTPPAATRGPEPKPESPAAGLELPAELARLWRQAGTPTPHRPNKGDRTP